MSNHELTQIFYDGLGLQDRYLLDAVSNDTFMRKYEDDTMELIEMVAEVQNLLLDRLDICNGSERLEPVSLQEPSPCDNCSRLNHVKLDCPIMAVQGKGMYR